MAEKVFTLPLVSIPQRFGIVLGGMSLVAVTKWNENSGWVLDIIDGITDKMLIAGIPLVTGADLLEQYKHIGIPGSLFAYTDGNQYAPPTETNLGTESNVYYLVDV